MPKAKKQLDKSHTPVLEEGEENKQIQSGDDLALDALSKASISQDDPDDSSESDDEVLKSDELAKTLTSLQNLIERHANELTKIKEQIREKGQSLRNVFENDIQLAEAKSQADSFSQQLKDRKSQLQSDPQVTNLKVEVSELKQQSKEIEETLSNHLLNLYRLTNSTSFDTSDGDQWEFQVRAKIKTRKK